MNVTLCSAFRNSEEYLNVYFEQIRELDNLLYWRSDRLTLILGEGDSTDNTRAALDSQMNRHGFTGQIIDVTHGGETWGSVVHPDRFRQLAYVWNRIWQHIPASADVVIFCESDLIWEASTILALIDDLEQVPCVAPFVAELSTKGFYDCFAYRKDGKHFAKHAPYFDGWPMAEMVQIDSAGSCLVMNAELARHLTWPEDDVVVGLCRDIYTKGGSIWLNSDLKVFHK